ncbi:MAG TPA: class I SAM-dependent methyltransferase [Myxococcaceae bacterium]|nr:class I SAM-dependent methyltransferase [Myxococcaceae bacterium]
MRPRSHGRSRRAPGRSKARTARTPGAIAAEVDEVLEWTRSSMPDGGRGFRVLEVGCGPGYLAARLLREGVQLTAIDASEEQVRAARRRGVPAIASDFLSFEGEGFDVVLFTRSLHHISPLQAAITKIRALLRPGGLVLADEFAHEEIDAASATWFWDLQAILEESGALAPDAPRSHHHRHGQPPAHPVERWRWRHVHDPPLHPGRALISALGGAFEITAQQRGPYLHRYLSDRLEDSPRGRRLFLRLRALEELRLEQGLLVPIGLRLVATVPRAV